MTLSLAENSRSTKIHENFFTDPLSTANKEYRKSPKINFNNEQSNLGRLLQSNAFPIPAVVSIVPDRLLSEYHYTYRYKNKDFVVRHLFTLKRPNESIISAENRILLQGMLSEIDDLLKNEYDWDEIDYIKPTPEDINYAKSVLRDFVFTISSEGYSLKKPYISNFEEGGASIKWKIGDRTLYLEIGQNVSIFSKVWRESGKLYTIDRGLLKKDYLLLWKWVINEQI